MGKYKVFVLTWIVSISFLIHANEELVKILNKSIQEHSQASDFHTWDKHKLNPKSILPVILSYPESDICNAFSILSKDNLKLFYGAISTTEKKIPLCLHSAINIINADIFKISAATNSQLPKPNWVRKKDVVEVELDHKNGAYYVFADLPPKHIALTFDDGPHPILTMSLLNILASNNIKATFFILGKNVTKNRTVVQSIQYDGHTLANHTHSHKNLRQTSAEKGQYEITQGFNEILSAVDTVSPFFRFPYGNYTQSLRSFLKSNDVAEFFWSVDTMDWKYKNTNTLLNYALKQTRKVNRGIILFHDIQPQTIEIMPTYIALLKKEGYRFVLFKSKEFLENDLNRN